MIELIFLIILILSLAGLGFILYRKLPLLLELPEAAPTQFNWKDLSERIKKALPFKDFSFQIFLQKILSKIRLLTLKIDSKTSIQLQKLRKESQRKKVKKNDNYWQEIKSFKKKIKKSTKRPR